MYLRKNVILKKENKILNEKLKYNDFGQKLKHCPCCFAYAWVILCRNNDTYQISQSPKSSVYILCYSSTDNSVEYQNKWYRVGVDYYNDQIKGIFKIIEPHDITIQNENGEEETIIIDYPKLYRTFEYAERCLNEIQDKCLFKLIEQICKCTPQLIVTINPKQNFDLTKYDLSQVIQKIDEIYQLIDEYKYWKSQYYQKRSSPHDTIDEMFAALEQVCRRVNKFSE